MGDVCIENNMGKKTCGCLTYLKSGEVFLHVAPAEEPHLVVRFVVVKLDGIGVCADGLQR